MGDGSIYETLETIKRRGFLKALAAAAVATVTPTRPLVETVTKWQEVKLIKFYTTESIGTTIANPNTVARLQFR